MHLFVRILIVIAALAALPFSPATAAAQSTTVSTKPPHRQVQTVCAACVDQAKAVNQAYDGLNFLWDRKLAIEKSLAIVERITGERDAEIARLESATPPSGRTAPQQQAIDSLKQINEQQRAGMERQRRQLSEIDQRITEQQATLAGRKTQLAECEKRCATPPADPPLTASAGPTPGVTIPDTGRPTINVNCPGCRRYADHILDLMEERAEILEEMSLLETELEMMSAGMTGTGPAWSRLNDPKRHAIYDDLDDMDADLAEIDAELFLGWRMLTNCILACNLVPKKLFTRPLLFGAAIGAGALGILGTAGGGDQPPAVNSPTPPPVAAPDPTPTPPPAPPPPPPPAPRADGDYACINCGVQADSLRHDPNIQLCRFILALFSVREGSITISHPAPFVPITGDYNTSTGAFTATGRGTVAGFSNVGVRGEGTVNTTTGRITMLYTMGTGGELPGGQPITYSLTLQKP